MAFNMFVLFSTIPWIKNMFFFVRHALLMYDMPPYHLVDIHVIDYIPCTNENIKIMI